MQPGRRDAARSVAMKIELFEACRGDFSRQALGMKSLVDSFRPILQGFGFGTLRCLALQMRQREFFLLFGVVIEYFNILLSYVSILILFYILLFV